MTTASQLPIVDLRSDTVTRRSKGMLAAISAAKVGDDVYGDDPTVNSLEERAAEMFGKEAGLFAATGSLTNQLAIKIIPLSLQNLASPGRKPLHGTINPPSPPPDKTSPP